MTSVKGNAENQKQDQENGAALAARMQGRSSGAFQTWDESQINRHTDKNIGSRATPRAMARVPWRAAKGIWLKPSSARRRRASALLRPALEKLS